MDSKIYFLLFGVALVVAVLAMLAMATTAWAGNYSASGTFWRVTDIFETHTAEDVLIGRELELSCGSKKIYVNYSPDDPAWSEVKKVQIQSWLWINTLPGDKVIIFFGVAPSAQMELGNILD